MHIEQKQNRIYRPQSVTTLSAEESNQVTTELENLITAGSLTPSAGTLTQVRDAVQNVVNVAKNDLQQQIDAITSASDVFDVVGTYAELQAYDTSIVPINDIIKVLQDSTHNNAATYYRLIDESGALTWSYVGQEGPYYTKSETDLTFATKLELPGIATTSQVGLVKPDGQTITVQADGTLNVSSNVSASLPLFTYIWADHILNNASYLRSDTFSWQSGAVYVSAYNHLVDDIDGVTAETETIAGTTITFKRASDGHKIVDDTQVSNVEAIYTATGTAWYYILDTTNQRFKMPRSIHGNIVEKYESGGKWCRVWSDGWCEQGGLATSSNSNITITFLKEMADTNYNISISCSDADKNANNTTTAYWDKTTTSFGTNVSLGGVFYIEQISWEVRGYVANFPENSQYKYLYFYVGNTIQNETSVNVAELSEDLNGKADTDLGNLSNAGKIVASGLGMPSNSYDDLIFGADGATYTAPADGYFYLEAYQNSTAAGCGLGGSYFATWQQAPGANNYLMRSYIPVKKGQVVTGYVYGTIRDVVFRFIYAEGSKSLA